MGKEIKEKAISSRSTMADKSPIGNLEDNLNNETDSYSKIKNSNHGLTNLLESIKQDEYDSGNDSDRSSENASFDSDNSDALIEKMSSFDINKIGEEIKDDLDIDQKVSHKNKMIINETNKHDIPNAKQKNNEVKNDFDSVKLSGDLKNTKRFNTTTVHIKKPSTSESKNKADKLKTQYKQQSSSSVNEVKNDFDSVKLSEDLKKTRRFDTLSVYIKKPLTSESKKKADKVKTEYKQRSSSSVNEVDKNVTHLSEKLSSIKISEEKKETGSSKSLNTFSNKSHKNKEFLIERGPVPSNKNYSKIVTHPYDTKQVNRTALSGGHIVMDEPYLKIDDIITNNNLVRHASSENNNRIHFSFHNTESHRVEEIRNNLEHKNSQMFQNINYTETDETLDLYTEFVNEEKIREDEDQIIKKIMDNIEPISRILPFDYENKILKNHTSIFEIENFNSLNPTNHGNTHGINNSINSSSPLEIQSELNQDYDNSSPDSDSGIFNRSSYENLHITEVGSPMTDSVVRDTDYSYGSPTIAIPSVSQSYESISSSNSPIFYEIDDICALINIPDHSTNTNVSLNVTNNLSILQSPAPSSSCSSYSSAGYEYTLGFQSPNNLYNDNYTHGIDNNFHNVDASVPVMELVQNCINRPVNQQFRIASNQLPCCVNNRTSANSNLIEMFENFDSNIRNEIIIAVHRIDENRLERSFDGLLAGWNTCKPHIPKLLLLFKMCDRLLMKQQTMKTFLKVYHNGHTLLDRAVLTCFKSPLVAKYIAECMLTSMRKLSHKENPLLDEIYRSASTVLHRAVKHGEQCLLALASLLSINEQHENPVIDINKVDEQGYTPLHIACSQHSPAEPGFSCPCYSMAHVLLKHGKADPNRQDRLSKNTALHMVINKPACALNLISLLSQHGAKLSIKNYCGQTPLDLAKEKSRSSPNDENFKKVLDILKKLNR